MGLARPGSHAEDYVRAPMLESVFNSVAPGTSTECGGGRDCFRGDAWQLSTSSVTSPVVNDGLGERRSCYALGSLQIARHLRSTRVLAALTALAFVLSNIAGLVHETTTKHVRCAEHGELVDATAGVAPPAVGDDPVAQAAGDGVPSAKHAHCAFSSAMRASRVLPRSPAIAPARVTIVSVALHSRDHAAASGAAIYRTAPKTSPPV